MYAIEINVICFVTYRGWYDIEPFSPHSFVEKFFLRILEKL